MVTDRINFSTYIPNRAVYSCRCHATCNVFSRIDVDYLGVFDIMTIIWFSIHCATSIPFYLTRTLKQNPSIIFHSQIPPIISFELDALLCGATVSNKSLSKSRICEIFAATTFNFPQKTIDSVLGRESEPYTRQLWIKLPARSPGFPDIFLCFYL